MKDNRQNMFALQVSLVNPIHLCYLKVTSSIMSTQHLIVGQLLTTSCNSCYNFLSIEDSYMIQNLPHI